MSLAQAVSLLGEGQQRSGFKQPGAPLGNERAPKVALTRHEGGVPIGHSIRACSGGRSLAGQLCRETER